MTSNDLAFIEFDPKSPELSYLDEDKKLSYTPECLKRFVELGANKIFGALKLKVSDQDREAMLHVVEKGLIRKEELNEWEKTLLFYLWNEKSFWNSFLREIFNKKMLYSGVDPLKSEYDNYIKELDKVVPKRGNEKYILKNFNTDSSKLMLIKKYSYKSNADWGIYFEDGKIKPLVINYGEQEYVPQLRNDFWEEEAKLPTGKPLQPVCIYNNQQWKQIKFSLDENMQPIEYQHNWKTYFLSSVRKEWYVFWEIKIFKAYFTTLTGEKIVFCVTEDMEPVKYEYNWKTYLFKDIVKKDKSIWWKELRKLSLKAPTWEILQGCFTENVQPWKKTIRGEEYLLTDLSVRNKENIWNLFKATFLNEQGEEIQCYLTLEGEILSYVNQNGEEVLVKDLDTSGKVLTYLDQNGEQVFVPDSEKVSFMPGTDLEKPLIFIGWTWGGTLMLANEEKSGEGNKEESGNKKFWARIRNFFNRKK